MALLLVMTSRVFEILLILNIIRALLTKFQGGFYLDD